MNDDFEFVSLDGNMGPRTVDRLKALLDERLHGDYPIEAPGGSDVARVLARRKIEPAASRGYRRKIEPAASRGYRMRWVIPERRMKSLLPSLLRSARDDERDLGSSILTTLNIEVV